MQRAFAYNVWMVEAIVIVKEVIEVMMVVKNVVEEMFGREECG